MNENKVICPLHLQIEASFRLISDDSKKMKDASEGGIVGVSEVKSPDFSAFLVLHLKLVFDLLDYHYQTQTSLAKFLAQTKSAV